MITTLRPVAFYTALLSFNPVIKKAGIMASDDGDLDLISRVLPVDIALATAKELTAKTRQRKVRYIVNNELSCNEVAAILESAIGNSYLKWNVVSEEDVFNRRCA